MARLSGEQWAGLGIAALTALAGAVAWIFSRQEAQAVTDASDRDPTPVLGDASALALASGETPEVYALARVITSEASVLPRAAQVGVGWATVNLAAQDNVSLWRLITGTAGQFGGQGTGGRKVSSRQSPGAYQIELARQIVAQQIADPTGGATQFDSPREQRREYDAGQVRRTPDDVADVRQRQGYELVILDGVDPEVTRFWRLV